MTDFSDKLLDITGKIVTVATQLDDLYTSMEELQLELLQCPTLTDDLLSSGGSTKHLSSSDIATLMNRFLELVTWIDEPGQYRRDILRKARR